MASDLRRLAIELAEGGVAVFPCVPSGKQPRTPHGYRDATTETEQVARWWRRWPTANIGLPTGHEFDVLDVDVKNDAPGRESMMRLKRAGFLDGYSQIVATPSGGFHFYFAASGEGNHSLQAAGIDYRGMGGYVLAPGSRLEAGEYLIVDRSERASSTRFPWCEARALLQPDSRASRRSNMRSGTFELRPLASWVSSRPEGCRNEGLFWAANRALEQGHDPDALVPAAVAAGLAELEARRTVESARQTTRFPRNRRRGSGGERTIS